MIIRYLEFSNPKPCHKKTISKFPETVLFEPETYIFALEGPYFFLSAIVEETY